MLQATSTPAGYQAADMSSQTAGAQVDSQAHTSYQAPTFGLVRL